MVGLKDNGEKKNKGVEKEKEKIDKVVTSEKVVSEEEKKKTKKQATNKGKAIVNHPPV